MDLIYTDTNGEDVDILHGYSLDEAFGEDENNFELKLNTENYVALSGCRIYCKDTEYGGIVDAVEVDSGEGEVTFPGRTWHGILEKKILCPDAGEAYLTASGDLNSVLATLITRVGLQESFTAPEEAAGVEIDAYRFGRYVDAYSGICAMLQSIGRKLKMAYKNGKVKLWAEEVHDYSQDDEWDSSQTRICVKKVQRSVNHLVCLGGGSLADRTVIHKYADADGNVSGTQTFYGVDEICEKYDYPNVESAEELDRLGEKELRERISQSGVSSTELDTEDSYDVGDIVGAREHITGVTVTRRITKKIVKIVDGYVTEEYKIGE